MKLKRTMGGLQNEGKQKAQSCLRSHRGDCLGLHPKLRPPEVLLRIALGRKYGGETDFKELMERFTRQLGTLSIGSYVPWLGWIDWVSGLEARLKKTENDFDKLLERVVQEHEAGKFDKTDFVDVLLGVQKEKSIGFEVDRLSIKAIVLDVFVGGTDTSSTLLEWEMTELLSHPECLKTLQDEVHTFCKGRSSVT